MSTPQPVLHDIPERSLVPVRNPAAVTRSGNSAGAAVYAQTDEVTWPDVAATLAGITSGALAAVAAAQHASVAWARGRWLTGQAPTHRSVARLDAWQAELGQGPCLDVLREQHTVTIPDMRREARWPVFAARATDLHVGSMLSMPLSVRRESLGVLNLYATRPHAFTDGDQTTGAAFATRAAIALYRAVERDHVRALASRDVIGRTIDILMRRHHLTAAAAFDRLVHAARGTDLPLAEVACGLVDEADHRPSDARSHQNSGRPARPNSLGAPKASCYDLGVILDRVGAAVVVHARGEVDMHTAPSLAVVLRAGVAVAGTPGRLVIDLTGIRFFSAAGLTLLVTTRQQCHERRVVLRMVATHRSVLRLLQITGLNALFDIVPSLEDATGRAGLSPHTASHHVPPPDVASALPADATSRSED